MVAQRVRQGYDDFFDSSISDYAAMAICKKYEEKLLTFHLCTQ